MAAGIEMAGLALAVFPVAIKTINWYSGMVTSHEIKLLADSLNINKLIFLQSVEYLLRSVVSTAKLRELLDNLQGPAWKDKALAEQVANHLGADYDNIVETMNDIYRTILKLTQKLATQSNTTKNRNSIADRAKLVVKCFVHGPSAKISLDRLKNRINEFRMLVEGSHKLASPPSSSTDALRDLNRVQECADGLHDALQAGWTCTCDEGHPANIQLEIWSPRGEKGSENISFKFSLLFASDAEHAQADHWITAEITLSQTATTGVPSLVCRSIDGSIGGAGPPHVAIRRGGPDLSAAVAPSGAALSLATDIDDAIDLCDFCKKPRESSSCPSSPWIRFRLDWSDF